MGAWLFKKYCTWMKFSYIHMVLNLFHNYLLFIYYNHNNIIKVHTSYTYSTKHIEKTYLWTAAQLLLSSSKGYKNFAILCLCNDCLSSCSDDTVSIFNRRSCARCTCDFCFRTISNAIPRYFTLMCQWVDSLFPSLQDILFATRFTGSFSVVTDFFSKRILLWTPYTDTKIPSKQHNTTLD